MVGELLAALEATELARLLRNSVYAYPLINTAHLLGVAILVGAIIPLDLRLLGAWPSVPLAPLWLVLPRTAGTGLVLAIFFGLLLFTTRATEYAASSLFIAKMVLVSAAAINALVMHRIASKRLLCGGPPAIGKFHWPFRLSAGISLSAWSAALILGCLVGYF